jgi:large subunit ribosomal protein L31e
MAKKTEAKEKIERSYNVPLRKSFRPTAKHKKTPRALRTLRDFLKKHMKVEEVKLGMHLNEHLWKHGIKNPPHHVKVHVIKEGNVARAELEGFEFKEAVKSEKKEPETMKDKLAAKLGAKEVVEEKKKADEKKPEEKKAEENKEAPKAEKKEASAKEKTRTAHELAAKKQ